MNQLLRFEKSQRSLKRNFDIFLSIAGLIFSSWIMLIGFVVATIDTRENGFFIQKRVGKNGQLFNLIKLRTMKTDAELYTSVTTKNDRRISWSGRIIRKMKIDELPQLFNVLKGDMSFVGPRPDVPGFADTLNGKDQLILSIRPGITGPATLKYKEEEKLLASVEDPEVYNREVIWPDKVRINIDYIENWNFRDDIRYILKTIVGESSSGFHDKQ
ncbi:sugar transferase [Desulfospira joergensenii]|uniref:sugar transferase n=1 Tax=Desulfospira joergensenii TaxID=53329 RepID=UPI0003B55892|nr:sugar transferase [Desulfospira joergensenii]